jgi:hypothetical protein
MFYQIVMSSLLGALTVLAVVSLSILTVQLIRDMRKK